MAIYSFNHDSFGKTTSRAGAAGGNAAYNARESETKLGHANGSQSEAARVAAYNAREEATYALRSHVIPPGPKEAEAWFRQQEKAGRKNARMRPHEAAAMVRNLMSQKVQAIRAAQDRMRVARANLRNSIAGYGASRQYGQRLG